MTRFSNSIIDICEHLKLNCTKLPRSSKGARLLGIELRKNTFKHNEICTPITYEFLNNAEECQYSDDKNDPVSLDSVDSADSAGNNLMVDFNGDKEVF